MSTPTLFFLAIGCYLSGAILVALPSPGRRLAGRVTLVVTIAAGALLWYLVVQVFLLGPVKSAILYAMPGIHAELMVHIDLLSAFFLAVIATMAVLVSFFALDYMQIEKYRSFSPARFYSLLLVFFAAVSCVVSVQDLFFFFIFWEIMTLTSYALVVYDRTDPQAVRAGFKYFLITHIATALLFVASMILFSYSGSFSFQGQGDAMALLLAHKPVLLHLVLCFFFLGFATKAGILPMGDWLPAAYASAPTPATAAFAGSMTKLGVYGLLRIFVCCLPVSAHTTTWGAIIALFGAVSIFIGTLTALVQDEAKKLLSFHVIGQMGYMFLGIGVGLYFLPSQPALAVIAIAAGLFHLLNNVCYKSSLFFSAGVVQYGTGTSHIGLVGGLSKFLPATALLTMLASFSIAGLPPFNGFASKWLIYQVSIKGGTLSPLFVLLAIIAIFISAVTLASFVKFSTALFFGKYVVPDKAAVRQNVPRTMMIGQIVLVFLCVLFGVFPRWPLQVIITAVTSLLPASHLFAAHELLGSSWTGALLPAASASLATSWNALLLVAIFVPCLLIAWAIYRASPAGRRQDETWYCGELMTDEEVRYPAHSYYLPFKEMFSIRIGRYQRAGVYPTIKYPKITFAESDRLKKILSIDRWFYEPLTRGFNMVSARFSATHSGIPHVYLLWLVIGTVAAVTLLFVLS
jgi:hydrogenase-4 component B